MNAISPPGSVASEGGAGSAAAAPALSAGGISAGCSVMGTLWACARACIQWMLKRTISNKTRIVEVLRDENYNNNNKVRKGHLAVSVPKKSKTSHCTAK